MISHSTIAETDSPHFIGSWTIDDLKICDDIVAFFEANRSSVRPGVVGDGVIRAESKQSLDLTIRPAQLETEQYAPFANYMVALKACYHAYLQTWPFLGDMLERIHISKFNVQKYENGGHFSDTHSERTSIGHLHRVLVWMTYLNDVDADGETEFTHYGIKVRPQKGRTLIWPAEWTHAHRGCPVTHGHKYIITGWFHFPHD